MGMALVPYRLNIGIAAMDSGELLTRLMSSARDGGIAACALAYTSVQMENTSTYMLLSTRIPLWTAWVYLMIWMFLPLGKELNHILKRSPRLIARRCKGSRDS